MNFVNNCSKIEIPLKTLLKKTSIAWKKVEEQAFSILKEFMCTTLVLPVPDFTNTFFIGM